MDSNYILDKLSEEISYRVQQCEKVWNEDVPVNKFSEFKAFIFSLGSAMDIVRVHLFFDFLPENKKKQKNKKKYFTDLFDNKTGKLLNEFERYLKEKIDNQKVATDIIKAFNKTWKIFFGKKYMAYCREVGEEKCYQLWEIYNKLKHTSIIEKSYIISLFTNDIVGTSGDLMIIIFDENHFYELHFPGKPVFPEGMKPEDFGYSSENQTLDWIKDISKEIINFLKALKNNFKYLTKMLSSRIGN